MSIKLSLILVIAALSSCTPVKHLLTNKIDPDNAHIAQKEYVRWENLLGKWYSKNKVSKKDIQECLITRFENGTYIAEFKITEANGNITKQTETGDWGLVKKFHFTTYRTISDKNSFDEYPANSPSSFDIYKIGKQKASRFHYKSIRTRNKFKSVKVESEFKLN